MTWAALSRDKTTIERVGKQARQFFPLRARLGPRGAYDEMPIRLLVQHRILRPGLVRPEYQAQALPRRSHSAARVLLRTAGAEPLCQIFVDVWCALGGDEQDEPRFDRMPGQFCELDRFNYGFQTHRGN